MWKNILGRFLEQTVLWRKKVQLLYRLYLTLVKDKYTERKSGRGMDKNKCGKIEFKNWREEKNAVNLIKWKSNVY